MEFKGRVAELERLEDWWENDRWKRMALVWGRRRVGKTSLIRKFAEGKSVIFHTGGNRSLPEELTELFELSVTTLPGLSEKGAFQNWDRAFQFLDECATDGPLLLVLDEFPELIKSDPALPGIMRAFWDRAEGRTNVRILLCGSAVRTMFSIQTYREPLYGRFDLALPVRPFSPVEATEMLPNLSPSERAVAYGIVGGMPLYLSFWNQRASVEDNLLELFCRPGAPLQTEGELILATEAGEGDLPGATLTAIASGRTKFSEISDYIGAPPTKVLERLIRLQLIRSITPVTDDNRSKRKYYRITDNFLGFFLGPLARYQSEIEMGVGEKIVPSLAASLPEHLGRTYEDAFHSHLRRLMMAGELGDRVVAVGEWWTTGGQDQIDAVVLAEPDRTRVPILVGEVKWTKSVNASRIMRQLIPKARNLVGDDEPNLKYVVCARDEVTHGDSDTYAVTADDIFTTDVHPLRRCAEDPAADRLG